MLTRITPTFVLITLGRIKLPTEYINGADSQLYINGIRVTEALQITYNESLTRLPIYAYNKKRFSRVADGNGIISGSIEINQQDHRGFLKFLLGIKEGWLSADSTDVKASATSVKSILDKIDRSSLLTVKTRAGNIESRYEGNQYKSSDIDNAIKIKIEGTLSQAEAIFDFGKDTHLSVVDTGQLKSSLIELLEPLTFYGSAREAKAYMLEIERDPNLNLAGPDPVVNNITHGEATLSVYYSLITKWAERIRLLYEKNDSWQAILDDPYSTISPVKPDDIINTANLFNDENMKKAMRSAFWGETIKSNYNSSQPEINNSKVDGAMELRISYPGKNSSSITIKEVFFTGLGSMDSILTSANKTWSLPFFASHIE